MSDTDFTQKLHDLMQRVGISSFKALSRTADVSERQICGCDGSELGKCAWMSLLKLSQALKLTLNELVATFSQVELVTDKDTPTQELLHYVDQLKKEYERSQQQIQQQRQVLQQEFQQSSLQLLESLLLQFPTAAHKARENPQLPAVNIVPLVHKPLEKLLQQWGWKR
jgi:translation initiation factor 2 beta subunit (eIF-2beta)/eIF-5